MKHLKRPIPIYLTPKEHTVLKLVATEVGTSMSDVVRDMIKHSPQYQAKFRELGQMPEPQMSQLSKEARGFLFGDPTKE